MKGTKIDFSTWPRTPVFQHFVRDVKCVVSVTADVDVTALVDFCKQNGLRFYPCFMHAVATVVNGREEFRMGHDADGAVILWDAVHPSYIDFHPEDEGITRLVSRYSPDFAQFYQTVLADMETHRDKRGFEIAYDRPNTFDVSCLPWLHFRALDLYVFSEAAYLPPVITWGKYAPANGRLMMPLSLRVHHAVADGFHMARFYRELDAALARMV